MKKQFYRIILASILVIACSASAFAADAGPYVCFNAGAVIPSDMTLNEAGTTDVKMTFDTGYAVNGAAGYAFNNNVRVEGEIGYKSADTNTATVGTVSGPNDATYSSLNFMVNAYYDIKQVSKLTYGITPFVGVGIGVAHLETTENTWAPNGNAPRVVEPKGSDDVFAYQIIAGVSSDVTKHISFDLSYRFVGTNDATFTSGVPGAQNKVGFDTHNILAGLRYTF
jgi:opacity protein-like surface antigen